MAKLLLNDKELEKVTGGAQFTLGYGTLNIDLTKGLATIDSLFENNKGLILSFVGEQALEVCEIVINTINKHIGKITKCSIDISTLTPTYFVGSVPYTQEQVDSWK